MDGIFLWKHECGQDLQLHLRSVRGKEWHWTPTPIKWEKTGWKNAGDVPCWNQPRQREANSGFMMNKILKIAQGIRLKRITPGRFGNSICGSERHTGEAENTLTLKRIKEHRKGFEKELEKSKLRGPQNLYETILISISFNSHMLVFWAYRLLLNKNTF